MNKPDLSKCATSEDYYKKLAHYYQVMYNEQKVSYESCLERLIELEEVRWNEGEPPYWRNSGEFV